jgi:hypothetical protein
VNDRKTPTVDELNDAAQRVSASLDLLKDTQQRYQFASSEATRALNAFNEATKQFDEITTAFRKSAPRDTDWARDSIPPRGRA